MARRTNKEERKQQRLQETAVKMLILGTALAAAPLVLGSGTVATAFKALSPIGFLLLAAGGVVFWLSVRAASRDTPHEQPARPAAKSPQVRPRAEVSMAPPADMAPKRPTSWHDPVLEVIEWRRFEALVETLFQQGGFLTESQSHGADGGVDIRLYSRHQPGHPVSLVQCKHWKTKRVGVDKVRELQGVLAAHKVPRGQLVCSSSFTPDAVAFAKDNSVNLLGADELLSLIRKRSPEQQQALLEVALEGEYWKPTCASCGTKMVERAPRGVGRGFWGCANYPKCRSLIN